MNEPQRPSPGAPGAGDLFQLFRSGEARTKSELCTLTGLARSTVSLRIDALVDADLLRPAGEAASSGGRPPARIAFNPLARVVVAVDLGATHGTVAVTDLAGSILATSRAELEISAGPEPVLDWVVEAATALLADPLAWTTPQPTAPLVIGVGVGLPGPVEHSTGRPTNPPIMPGWDRFDVPAYIRRTIDVPVLVDNDVNVLALGEHAISWPDTDDLVYVKVSTGIGAGIIAGGELQRGALGAAGDIGHVQVPVGRDSPRPVDDERDLEAIASGPAIATALRAQGVEASSSRDVAALIRAGDRAAIETTRQAGREIGEVLSVVVNLLNPSVIVLGGTMTRAGGHLLTGVREVVYRRSMPLATGHLGIVTSTAGEEAGVLGAAIMVLREALSAPAVDAMTQPRSPDAVSN
ncbi:ROK family transcriptional regulator [Plantibacter sp. Leaf171]|uniref:ROK family transcriptional regulator n=1 Tax=unclassified Plantibacter TaxID=2624265 RepID=UPI0006FF099D|nr:MULTISPECIES: ROK family transcriptional regulator [unclassified Plantibacter]KQM17739.1 ROK family transcriptional regulator [Plantibacter sp. Leaf1]KQQ49613.1 ROK family transcriptional regulator [Plantibacter sp. Leaf314]KQR60521.1 ROK family transcriptional regulator [Plantibacter sp. Leaf171]